MSPRELATIPVASPEQAAEALRALGWLLSVAMWDRDLEGVASLIARREEFTA